METAALNYWAILVAALSAFLVGGMWYSPAVFGKTWMKENGFSEGRQHVEDFWTQLPSLPDCGNKSGDVSWTRFQLEACAFYGFLAGFGWVAMFIGTTYLFERKLFTLFAINAGYSVVTLTVIGIIIGAWR